MPYAYTAGYESDKMHGVAIALVCIASVPIKAFVDIEMVISYLAIF